mgnify:FL=1
MAKEKEPKPKQKRAKKKEVEQSTASTNAEQAIANAESPETAAPAQPAPQLLQPTLPQQPIPYMPRTSSSQLVLIIIGCIAGGVLFLLAICGGVLAYSIYQRPENVVLDAITKLQSANKFSTHTEITMDYKYDAGAKDISFKKLTLDTGMNSSPSVDANATLQMSVGGRDVSVKASALMTDDGTIYFKVKNLAEALSAFTGSKELPASAKNQLEKVSNKWVRYEINDLYKNNQRAAERVRCVQNVYKRSLKDSKKRREIVSTYRKYPFVMIESMAQPKDGNVGYTVWIEPVTWRQFNKAFAHTAIAQDIKACGPSTHDNSSVVPDDTDDTYANPAPSHSVLGHSKTKFTMWISPWSHELRALDIEGGSDARFSPKSHTKFDFSKGVATTKPNDSEVIHADEWNKRLNEAMNISSSSASSSDGS